MERTPPWVYVALISIVVALAAVWATTPPGPSGPGEPADHDSGLTPTTILHTTTSIDYSGLAPQRVVICERDRPLDC